MQWAFFNTPLPSSVLVRLRDEETGEMKKEPLEIGTDPGFASSFVRTKVQLRTLENAPMTATLEASLLRPLEDMIIGGQKVVIINSSNANHAAALKHRIGPSLTWLLPMVWRMLEVAQSTKRSGDEPLKPGLLAPALDIYHVFLSCRESCQLLHVPPECFDSECELPFHLFWRTFLEAVVTAGFTRLKLGDVQRARVACNRAKVLDELMQNATRRDARLQDRQLDVPCIQASH